MQTTQDSNQFPPLNDSEVDAKIDYTPEDVAISDMLAELGDDAGAMVRIYRQGRGGYRDQTFVDECLPSEFSPKMLQEKFGGGQYRIHARSNGGIVANRLITIAAPINAKPAQVDVIAPMQQQINALTEAMRTMVDAVKQGQQQPPQQSRKEMLEEMMIFKQLFDQGGRAGPAADPLDSVMKVLDLAKTVAEMRGIDSGEAKGKTDLLETFIDKLGAPLLQVMAAKQAALPAPAIDTMSPALGAPFLGIEPQAAPAMPGAVPASQMNEEQMQNFMMAHIRNKLDPLIDGAAEGDDVWIYVPMIIAKMPDAMLTALHEPEWFKNFCEIEPRAAQYGTWFAQLRDAVLEELTAIAEEDKTGGSLSGGSGHVPAGSTNTDTKRNT